MQLKQRKIDGICEYHTLLKNYFGVSELNPSDVLDGLLNLFERYKKMFAIPLITFKNC